MFRDDFDGDGLDRSVWLPHYLPAWSSRAATLASHRLEGGRLVLDVPVDHPVWCPDDHAPPLRVSGIQSGSWSGPVGSTRGQQRFADGLTVKEEQPRFEGWLPASGHVEIRCAMDLSPRSMAALWMAGLRGRRGAAALRRAVRRRGLRQRAAAGLRGGGRGHQGVPRPGPHPGLRGSPGRRRRVRVPHLRRRLGRRRRGVHRRRRGAASLPAPADVPAAAHGRGLRLPGGSTGDDDDLVPRLVVDHVAGW